MENDKTNRPDFRMTAEEAFEAMFGRNGKEYPEEMKREFAGIFDRMRGTMKSLRDDRAAFMEKWKDSTGGQRRFPDDMRAGVFALFGMFGRMGAPESGGREFPGPCGFRHGGGPAFFGW